MAPRRDGRRTHIVARGLDTATSALAVAYSAIAGRPFVSAILVTVMALLLAAAASAAYGFPPPAVHDEFSYLLGADTFASGRLTNPTHPMWRYFETFHVLQRPTYNSKYPPANALFIAAGWALTGRPIVGVWLSFAFMCVAVYWMLRAWTGGQFALGISLAFASWLAASYWSYSYWGGAVAAGAGALMLGALYRIVDRRAGAGTAILLGLGLLLLANSRPYEGELLALPAAVVLVRWLWRDRQTTWPHKRTTIVLPLLLVGTVGLVFMGVYNKAVTGRWQEMPYLRYEKQVNTNPIFLWQQSHLDGSHVDKAAVDVVTARQDSFFTAARTPTGRAKYVMSLTSEFFVLIIPVGLALPLLLLPLASRRRWIRFALITAAWMAIGMGVPTYFLIHYASPLVGVLLILYGDCLRWLSRFRAGARPVGKAFVAAIVALWFLMGVGSNARAFLANRRSAHTALVTAESMWQRRLIADTLSHGGRRNLVIVRYGGTHSRKHEWIYNDANIDASAVVWARDMGDSANRPLLQYFRDRSTWLVNVDSDTGPFPVSRYIPLAR